MKTAARLHEITRDYPRDGHGGFTRVLDSISLEIFAGDSIAITGPSGSGKTTLLNILGTLDRPTSGRVLINDINTADADGKMLASLRNRFIGFVFQQHHLLPQLTVLENVMLPLLPVAGRTAMTEGRTRGEYLLERVGMKDHMGKFPGGLSVGECQRVAVVRALINEPLLLLADEPTGSLDEGNASALTELLSDLQTLQSFSMVVVTHDPLVAGKMQRILRLRHGRLAGQ